MAIDSSYQRQFNKNLAGNASSIFDYDPYLDERGDFKKNKDIDTVIRSIRTLLMTPLGQYPFDPEYGSLLFEQIFEPFDEETLDNINFEIRDRIARYENRCKIDRIKFMKTQDGKGLVVNVFIDRHGVKGKVELLLNPQKSMLGLDDELVDEDY